VPLLGLRAAAILISQGYLVMLAMVSGRNTTAEAKMIGITPPALSLSGR
jgi:hypothetical protein